MAIVSPDKIYDLVSELATDFQKSNGLSEEESRQRGANTGLAAAFITNVFIPNPIGLIVACVKRFRTLQP